MESPLYPPRAFQRDVLLDARQDVGLKAQIIDKGLGTKRHQ
jgi:hypothetical protein